jgi:predicted transposase YdaD
MPRTLKADPKLTLLGRLSVMTLLKFLMLREEVSYRELAERLNRLGFEENERNLRNKITKGEMPAALFLILMRLLKAKSFPIEELPILQADIDYPEPPPTEMGP